MNWLEVFGAAALYILGLLVACAISVIVGARFGNGKEMGGLVFVICPPIVILVVGAIVGVFLLGRISG
ncbi:hypothetical protein OIU34_20575 [Pararhizobium sp. BT-229]|uniref:hypothetical protein n=1 Tax=Pararhizobium sp. BT-229 TaxID=2986923 RepID=UPI0021F75201|nr:hypothetical protein [Pararhizobium sp. BT-229]MCV9964285.1 hypothetical protein [Pararhizobium sp. BT-229]